MGSTASSDAPPDEQVAFYLSKAKETQMAAAIAETDQARRSFLAASNTWVADAATAEPVSPGLAPERRMISPRLIAFFGVVTITAWLVVAFSA